MKYFKIKEQDSLFLQLKHLWRSGQNAYFNLECRAGQAWSGEAHENEKTNQNATVEATGNCVKAVVVTPVTPIDQFSSN